MSRRNQQPLPGNDGQWFLELVGAVPGSATSSTPGSITPVEETTAGEQPSALAAVAALRNQSTDVPDETTTTAPPTTMDLATTADADPHEDEEFSHDTRAAVSGAATLGVAGAGGSRSEPAPTEVLETSPAPPPSNAADPAPPSRATQTTQPSPTLAETWRATPKAPAPPPPTERFAPVAAQPPRGRRSRWPLIVTIVVTAGALLVAALWLPMLVDGRASEQADEYRTALTDIRRSLPDTQLALGTATEPDSQEADLSRVSPQVEPLALAVDSAMAVAAKPLPEPLPLLPSGPIDDLVPSRDAVAAISAEATLIVARIADTTTYRLLLGQILVVPELPIEADAAAIDSLASELAAVDTESRNAAAQLPSDPAFAEHSELVTEAVTQFDDWTAQYLDALSAGDAELAAELTAQLETTRLTLTNLLVPGLRVMRNEVDTAILRLDTGTSAALADLP